MLFYQLQRHPTKQHGTCEWKGKKIIHSKYFSTNIHRTIDKFCIFESQSPVQLTFIKTDYNSSLLQFVFFVNEIENVSVIFEESL
jgi:hypothetical protein